MYVASKHAVEGLTKAAALEGAAREVRVNAVAPGPVETELLNRFAGSADKKAALAAGVPGRRLGTPEDIAAMIVFLASDKADFVTGQILGANGGKTALCIWRAFPPKEGMIMSETRYDDLPEPLKNVRTRSLFVMHLDVRPLVVVGATPGANRRIGLVSGGSFEGERLSGQVMDGGSDWQAVRADGGTTLDVRLVLKTKDNALIAMTYRGVRHGPAGVIKRMEKGEAVDPASYYFRISPLFETAAATYDWLNRVLAVGIGHRRPDGPVYSVFEVL